MGCCSDAGCGIGGCFSRFSRRYTKRYERKGLEATQKQLVNALDPMDIRGKSLLEIGCGVGYLHQHLLLKGARCATGVDLSPAMLKEAEALAVRQGLEARTHYVQGDFLEMGPGLEAADITLLDKVVCCYPDAKGLLAVATGRTKGICALTFPRGHWVNRAAARAAALMFRLVGSTYRPFVHSPHAIDGWIRAAGFRKVSEAHTAFWLTSIYQR